MWRYKSIHNLKTSVSVAGCMTVLLALAACNSVEDVNSAVIATANSGLSTQLLQNSLSVDAGTEQSALTAAVSTAVWTPSDKLKADVSAYFGQLGPKAFAITPPTDTGAQSWGSIHGARSTQEAQRDAIQICSNVASQRGINLPCSILFIENSQQPLGW
ncbi:MAG: hypothetical protein ACO3NE_11525 [Alphaproteobacteria bacterium]